MGEELLLPSASARVRRQQQHALWLWRHRAVPGRHGVEEGRVVEQQARGAMAAAPTAVVALVVVVVVPLCAADVDAAAMLQQSPWQLHELGLQQELRRVVQWWVVVAVAEGPRRQGQAPTFDCASPGARQLKRR